MSTSILSSNRPNRDSQQEILGRLGKMAGSQGHRDFLSLIQLKLEATKDKLISSSPEDLIHLQGQAKAFHDLLIELNRPLLSDLLDKKETAK